MTEPDKLPAKWSQPAATHPLPMSGDRRIRGYCPMGCGETLFIAAGGFITCSNPGCDRPHAVSSILAENETEHMVMKERGQWIVKHPLRERVGNALLTCEVPSTPPHPLGLGLYRVTRPKADSEYGSWEWEEVPQI